jgi:hypothetical protein
MQQLEHHLLRRTVDQAIMHEDVPGARPGDCLRAAMATITDRALLEVPHFVETPGTIQDFWDEVRGYVERVTLGTHMIECYDAADWLAWNKPAQVRAMKYAVILTGPSPRGAFSHAVVADPVTLEVIHDPHPTRAGILSAGQVYALLPLAPVFE